MDDILIFVRIKSLKVLSRGFSSIFEFHGQSVNYFYYDVWCLCGNNLAGVCTQVLLGINLLIQILSCVFLWRLHWIQSFIISPLASADLGLPSLFLPHILYTALRDNISKTQIYHIPAWKSGFWALKKKKNLQNSFFKRSVSLKCRSWRGKAGYCSAAKVESPKALPKGIS